MPAGALRLGENEEHFKFSVFLVMNNRLVSMTIAIIILAGTVCEGCMRGVRGVYGVCMRGV